VKTPRVFCKSLTNFCKCLKIDSTIALFLSFHTVSAVFAINPGPCTDGNRYLSERCRQLEQALGTVDALAQRGELPDAIIAAGELKITPLTNTVPEEATALMRQAYALLSHVKITDLLLEVDRWTGFSRHFTHLKTGQPCEDRTLLLTAILADAINLGIAKMAEACPGTIRASGCQLPFFGFLGFFAGI
jgi:Tn3 transposase DDE domain